MIKQWLDGILELEDIECIWNVLLADGE